MKKWTLLLSLLAFSTFADQSIEFTFDTPTEREDGSTLLITEIDHYNIKCDDNDTMTNATIYEVDAYSNYYLVDDIPDNIGGLYCTISTVDSDLIEGASSDILFTDLDNGYSNTSAPMPPGSVRMKRL